MEAAASEAADPLLSSLPDSISLDSSDDLPEMRGDGSSSSPLSPVGSDLDSDAAFGKYFDQ